MKKLKSSGQCITGKRCFDSEILAEEALLINHIVNDYRENEGPVNVYECVDCRHWHFTSKGQKRPILDDPEVISRIKNERRATYWERQLR